MLEDKEIVKDADIMNLDESSTIKYNFKSYGKQTVKVIVTNSVWKSVELKKEIVIPKKLKMKNQIVFSENGTEMEWIKYEEKTKEYSLYEIWVPTTLKFDAKLLRADNPLYQLQEISWDVGNDGSIDSKEKSVEHKFELPWFEEVVVKYKFVHRKDKTDIIEMKDTISIELVEKEAILVLDVKPDSEYAPTLVTFDASLSKVNDDNIVKFTYDYGDGVIEERDAKNSGHRYLKEGNYYRAIVSEKNYIIFVI